MGLMGVLKVSVHFVHGPSHIGAAAPRVDGVEETKGEEDNEGGSDEDDDADASDGDVDADVEAGVGTSSGTLCSHDTTGLSRWLFVGVFVCCYLVLASMLAKTWSTA